MIMLCEKYGDEEFNLRHCCYCDLRSLYYSCICIRRCNSVLTYTQGNMNTYMYVLGKSFFFFILCKGHTCTLTPITHG